MQSAYQGKSGQSIERDLQKLRAADRVALSADTTRSFQIVTAWGHRTATGLLRGWHVRNPSLEAQDVSQEWITYMHVRGFALCDANKPIYPYAYIVLRHMSVSALMAYARRTKIALVGDLANDVKASVDEPESIDRWAVVESAIVSLPRNLRDAIEKSLLPRKARGFAVTGRQQHYNRVYRARLHIERLLGLPIKRTDRPRRIFVNRVSRNTCDSQSLCGGRNRCSQQGDDRACEGRRFLF